MDVKHYLDFYYTNFGRKILERELEFIQSELVGCKCVLSIGCGPAILEARLAQLNPDTFIIGLDNSKEMLAQAPKFLNVVLGDAKHLGFKDNFFDGIFYITSLEFIDDYEKAIEETVRVLRPKGKGLFLILNPESRYFQEEHDNENSYINKNIKHTGVEEIKAIISRHFFLESKYFLGIKDREIIETNDPKLASLYSIKGILYENRSLNLYRKYYI